MLGLIAARASNVGLALLDQLAAKGFGYYATLVEVCHELPRDLQAGKHFVASSTEVAVPRLASLWHRSRAVSMHIMIMQLHEQRVMPVCSKVLQTITGNATPCSSCPLRIHSADTHQITMGECHRDEMLIMIVQRLPIGHRDSGKSQNTL